MLHDLEWYPRLSAVPGVSYLGKGPDGSSVTPSKPITPKMETLAGNEGRYLYWPSKEGWTSATPASQAASFDANSTSANLLKCLEDVLELPGKATCYHFAIQRCCEILWKRRRGEPEILSRIEAFYLTDVKLVEARPTSFCDDDGQNRFFAMSAFPRLLSLYITEGFLLEAADIAALSDKFGQSEGAVEKVALLAAAERGQLRL